MKVRLFSVMSLIVSLALLLALVPATAAPPEPLNTLSNTEATEAHFSDFSVPSASSAVQDPLTPLSPGTTTRVSVASDGGQGNDLSEYASISADGRYVAFVSWASNLVSGDTNGRWDVFVHDRQTGQTTRVSVASDGSQGNGYSSFPSISADGRYVAFRSDASNLASGDTNGENDVFVHDRQTGQTTRVSVASDGSQGNSESWNSSISADGRYVAFSSYASNLVSGDTNGVRDVFVHDRQTGQTTRVSVASDGSQGNDVSSYSSISADGRYVDFSSYASNLVSGDTNGYPDVFVHDRQTGQTTRVSVASDGSQGNGESWNSSISADGRYVAFTSDASNLVGGDTNDYEDIFVHDREGGPGTTYFDDFSSYTPGLPPTGWLLRGATAITPTIEEVGGTGPAYRLVSFPEVPWQYWDKWLIKDGLVLSSSYTVSVKLNFQNNVADWAGLTIAWNDANWDRIDIQPNVYWDDIEFRVSYSGPITSSVVITDVGYIPISAFTDYWLKAVATDHGPGQGQVIVYWSTDNITFRPVVTATGWANLTGLAGIGTAGPHLPHTHFDDFLAVWGGGPGPTYSISGWVRDGSNNSISAVTVSAGAGGSATTDASGTYAITGLITGTYTLTPSKSGYVFLPATRTVSVPPNATGQDFTGSAGSPGPRGVNSLNPLFPLVSNQPLRAEVIVSNPGTSSASYTLEVSLWQGGTVLGTLPGAVTVAPGGRKARVFNFGQRAAGSYQLRARILQDGDVVDNLSRDITILEWAAQLQAQRAGQRLTDAAWDEFDEARDIVVTVYADSIPKLPGEAVGVLLHGLFLPLDSLGDYAGIPANKVAEASAKLTTKLFGVESLLQQTTRPAVEQNARGWVDESLAPERIRVQGQAADFDTYVASHPISWDEGRMAGIVSARERAIRGRVEWEIIPVGIGPPPLFLAPTTLKIQALVYRFYEFVHKLLGILGILAGVAAILVAVGVSGGTLGLLLAGLAAVGKSLWLWLTKPVTAVFLVVLALVLHLQGEYLVAPAITREHGDGLNALQTLSVGATGQAVPQVNTMVQVQGYAVDITTDLRADGLSPAEPFVETYLYTADGRVAGIFAAQPHLASGHEETIGRRTMLPPGQYRAVTVVHAGGQLAATSSQVAFAVDAPQVSLDVHLADAQLDPGQPLEATLTVTNTDPLSPTGDLALFALTTTGDAVETWIFNLTPGAAQQLPWRFVPQTGGPAILRASVLDASGELATRDAPYVVGAGAAVALNLSVSATHAPSADVPLTLTAINAGTQPTVTLVSLVTTDRETGQTMYTRDITLTLNAGEQVITDTVILPGARPGSYAVRADLNGQPYRTVDFAVTAQDTLYASVAAHSPAVEVGQAVTLTATVVNSVFTYTNASPVITVQNPAGVTQTVPITPVQTGQYRGQVTATMTGTHEVLIWVDALDCRVITQDTAFAAGQSSWLQPSVAGSPTLSQTAVVTITVSNENDVLLPNTSVAVSSTTGLLTSLTDAAGSAHFILLAQDTTPYTVTLARDGYGEAVFVLPVQVVSDTIPPALFLDVLPLTNRTPLTVTGLTEAGASLTINSQTVAVDAQGRFTTTVALSEGANTLNAAVTDAVSNTTTVTRTITLDTVPPTLTVTYPPDGLITPLEIISVTGSTEVGASLTVSDTLATVDPASGAFSAWLLLQPGVNTISIVATDAAENITTATRIVNRAIPVSVYLPLILRNR